MMNLGLEFFLYFFWIGLDRISIVYTIEYKCCMYVYGFTSVDRKF